MSREDVSLQARSRPLERRDGVAVAALVAAYGLLAWRFFFLSDDAFISFRYGKNWAEGHGLRYNLGDALPVEGYSNFLWVLVCGVVERLGGDPLFWAPALSAACGALLVVAVYRALRGRLHFSRDASFLATLSLALFPPFAVWATGGLETMPFALALFVTFDALVLRDPPSAGWAVLGGLATSLLRTEGICWALLVGGLALFGRFRDGAKLRSLGAYFALLVAGFGAYFLWRYHYYQVLLPNPVYLKVGFSSEILLRGFRYVAMFFLTFLTPFVLLPAGIAALARGPFREALASFAMALAVPAYAVVVGGDWMIMGRFLVPGLAFVALLFGWLLELVRSGGGARRAAAVGLGLGVTAIGLLPAANLHLVPSSVRVRLKYMYSHPGFRSEVEEWRAHKEGVDYAKEIGIALAKNARPGESLVAGAIGAIGYYSNLHVYDRFGLVSREVAEWAVGEGDPGPLRSPGHDVKVSRDFFLDEHPTYILFDVIDSPTMRSRVLDQARDWRALGPLWRRYAPDFFPLDGEPDTATHRVLMVYRAIEDETNVEALDRRERRQVRAERAEEAWARFYARAETLAEK